MDGQTDERPDERTNGRRTDGRTEDERTEDGRTDRRMIGQTRSVYVNVCIHVLPVPLLAPLLLVRLRRQLCSNCIRLSGDGLSVG